MGETNFILGTNPKYLGSMDENGCQWMKMDKTKSG